MNNTTIQVPETADAHPPSVRQLARNVGRDLWRALVPLIVFEATYKSAVFLIGVLGAGWIVAPLIARTGRTAVTNTEIARFLLSPTGLLYLVLIALSLMVATMIEHVGVIAIAAAQLRGRGFTISGTLADLGAVFFRLLTFGLRSLLTLAFLCAPFVVLGGLAYLALLSRQDINYYLADRPPQWYAALGIGGILLAALVALQARSYVGLIFVMPILLFGEHRGRAAIDESRALAAGARLRIGAILLGWQAVGTILSVAIVWGFGRSCAYLLAPAEARPSLLVPLVAGLLAIQAFLVAALSFLLVAVHCLLILQLYFERGGTLNAWDASAPWPIATRAMKIVEAAGPRFRRFLRVRVAIAVVLLGFIGYLGFTVPGRLVADVPIVVVAHRGCERLAPENTLSAFRKAIEIGADFAELDVQETADGVIVVYHDRDLMRLAGDPRRITDLTFAEARKIDLGRRFSPEFAGERMPTLEEVIALARGKIKLQIELKYYAKDRGLAAKVAELIRREDFEAQCEVTSLDYDGLMAAKRHNPLLTVVALVTYAVGDPGRLDVQGLSVNTKVLSDRLIRAMRRHDKLLYAWTVDDAGTMVRLIERGVGGLVTNAPEEAIRIRRERAMLSVPERRILAARYLLGLDSTDASRSTTEAEIEAEAEAEP
ncbi:MAG: glycerophosphodiester phosphodiesterase [Isosphaeraceae bacterium]